MNDRKKAGAARFFEQCLRNFESDSRAAERLAWILAAGLIRIQHGQRLRDTLLGFRQMMIGHDQIYAHRFAASAAAKARMPVSTLMIRRTPSAAARSITSSFMP